MNGISALDGTSLSGIDHLRQSIRDILTTPLGSRVMRRDYGSALFDLIDAPMNADTLMQIYAATADALAKWEPRFSLTKVTATSAEPGYIVLDLTGIYLPGGQLITLDGVEVS